MTEIVYKGFDNEDQLSLVQAHMEALRPLIPKETRVVYVNLFERHGENSDAFCSVNVGSLEYLYFEISIYFPWFDRPKGKQRISLIHELVHALHGSLLMFDRDNLIDYVKARNPELGDYVARQHTHLVERFTQRMAYAIDEMITTAQGRQRTDSEITITMAAHQLDRPANGRDLPDQTTPRSIGEAQ